MWMADAAGPRSRRISVGAAYAWIEKIVKTLNVWHLRARNRQALLRLSDHHLRDVGLTRYQVMIECGKPFWRA